MPVRFYARCLVHRGVLTKLAMILVIIAITIIVGSCGAIDRHGRHQHIHRNLLPILPLDPPADSLFLKLPSIFRPQGLCTCHSLDPENQTQIPGFLSHLLISLTLFSFCLF